MRTLPRILPRDRARPTRDTSGAPCLLVGRVECPVPFVSRPKPAFAPAQVRLGPCCGPVGFIELLEIREPHLPVCLALARRWTGLARVITHPESLVPLLGGRPELMVTTWAGDDGTAPDLREELDWASVFALGPGLGAHAWGRALFLRLTQEGQALDRPMVVDADGLNLLAEASPPLRSSAWILTPHPGEASRLLQIPTAQVEADRFAAARAIQQRYGGVVLLKGAGTVITDGAKVYVVRTGNPGMASGGMGDALTGIITGLLAQGVPLLDAATLGAAVHGEAGNRAAAQDGERGLLASDLFPHLRHLVNLRAGY